MSAVRNILYRLFQPDLTGNPKVDRLFRVLADLINPMLQNPLMSAVILEDRTLTTGAVTKLSHGMGRKPRGFAVMTTTAGSLGLIYSAQDTNPFPERELWVGLQSGGDVTATLLVY